MDNYSARALVQQAVAQHRVTRTVELIREELLAALAAVDAARARMRELQDELNEAKARELVPHPLLGKRVRRRHRNTYGSWTVQKGIMCQNASSRPLAVGAHRFRVYAGAAECYVRTLSGTGAYNVREDADNEPWELDE